MAWTGPIETIGWSNATGALDMTFTGFSATIPIGTLVFIANCQNTGSASTTCVDNSTQAGAANVWTVRAAVNGTTHHGRIMWCVLTRSILTTDTITVHNTAPGSRQSGMLLTFTTPLGSPVDVAVASGTLTTSPCAVGPTATLAGTGELAMACHYWKGGAVASGVADATSGYTLVTPTSSGGTTTNEEACVSYNPTAGTAAESNTKTFTSITNCVAEIITFKPAAPAAAFAPQAVVDTSMASEKAYRYPGSRSMAISAFDNPSVVSNTDYVQPAMSRPLPPYRGAKAVNSNTFDPLTNTFHDWAPAPVVERPTPFYRAPSPSTIALFDPALNTFANWVAAPTVDKAPPFYAPPRSLAIPVFPVIVTTSTDWTPVVTGRPGANYRGPGSYVMGAGEDTFYGTDWASVVISRAVAFYRGSPSSVTPVFPNVSVPPDVWTAVAQSYRPPARYLGSASLTIPVWDPATATFADWAPPALLNRVVPYLDSRHSLIVNILAPVTPDAIAGVAQSPRVPPLPGRPFVLSQVWLPTSVPDAFVAVAQSSRVVPPPVRLSQVVGLWTPAITPDAFVQIAQSPAAAPRRSLGSSVSIDFAAAAPAQGYVAVAQSAPQMRALVRQSLTILPQGDFFVVTQAPTGGGGEWVIWEKPSFPANRRDAWPSFVPPYFRKPSRTEKRGY